MIPGSLIKLVRDGVCTGARKSINRGRAVATGLGGSREDYAIADLADYIITEHGVASLRGASQRRRAEALVSIAHPDVRAELERQMRGVFWSTPSGPVSDAGGAQ